jgi:lipopolysaccharide/colanic/teichoic acid biosynthesis glycosyltransferase
MMPTTAARAALDSFYVRRCKRAIDCTLAAGAIAAFAPIMLAVAGAVLRRHGTPILLRQERTGLGGKPFRLIKFRTMTNEQNTEGRLLPDEQRLTPLGRFLRLSSLDELPELFNVLRGDMSLVGPRPLFHHYMQYYSEEQHRRHLVRPGITGWAAVNGRNTTSWEERFDLDIWYVDHISLKTDVLILLRTVTTILSREGVDPNDRATMPEFRGNPPQKARNSAQ